MAQPEDFTWLGPVVRSARERCGMTPTQLARRSGVSRWTIDRLETSERIPTLIALKKLADALDIPLSQVFQRAERGPCSTPATTH